MTIQKKVAGIACVFILALLSVRSAAPTSAAPPPTRIYVVAVHDSSLFTLCPPQLYTALASEDFRRLSKIPNYTTGDVFGFSNYRTWLQPNGTLSIGWSGGSEGLILNVPPPFLPESPGILERSRPDWQDLSQMVTGICPSGWVDSGMQKEIEAEFIS
jgi:hypothetical protein